jgi:hypothetical protein
MKDKFRACCERGIRPHCRRAIRQILVASLPAIGQRIRVDLHGTDPFQLQRKLTSSVDAPGRQRLNDRKFSDRSHIE